MPTEEHTVNPPKRNSFSLGGALVGLLAGALAGAGVFALSGNLDLRIGFLLLAVFAIIGAVLGSQAPRLLDWAGLKHLWRPTHAPVRPLSSQDFQSDRWHPSVPASIQTYAADAPRLMILTGLFVLLGSAFVYLEVKFGEGGFPLFLVYALPFFGVASYHLATYLFNSSLQVEVSPAGLSYSSNRERHFVGWGEVVKVWERQQEASWNGITMWNIHRLTIAVRDGRRIKLDRTLKRFGKLAESVQAAVTSHLLPRAIQTLENGGEVTFDEFVVTSRGIKRGQQFLPWPEVHRIIIQQERVQVRKTGKNWFNWADTKAWNVANLRLFAIVAKQYARVDA